MSKQTFFFAQGKVSNGRPRLVSDRMIAILSPNGKRWELYTLTDGLEEFGRYATEAEAQVLRAAACVDERGYSLVSVTTCT